MQVAITTLYTERGWYSVHMSSPSRCLLRISVNDVNTAMYQAKQLYQDGENDLSYETFFFTSKASPVHLKNSKSLTRSSAYTASLPSDTLTA